MLFNRVNGKSQVKLLVSAGADVNAKSERTGSTLMHYAAFTGSIETMEFLLSQGVRIDAKDKNGQTPLNRVGRARKNRSEVIKWLRAHGG